MQKQFYFLTPVEVVKVTPQNVHEVAEWCGGKVAQTESRRVAGRMDTYVWVPTPKGTAISWAFPGMFITRRLVVTVQGELKETWAVFRRDYFERNYFETPDAAVTATWAKPKKELVKEAVPDLEELDEKVALAGKDTTLIPKADMENSIKAFNEEINTALSMPLVEDVQAGVKSMRRDASL